MTKFTRRTALSVLIATGVAFGAAGSAFAADKVKLRLATSGSETDQRSVAMAEVFAPMVADFADYEPS